MISLEALYQPSVTPMASSGLENQLLVNCMTSWEVRHKPFVNPMISLEVGHLAANLEKKKKKKIGNTKYSE